MDQPTNAAPPVTLAELLDERQRLADVVEDYQKKAAVTIRPTVDALALVEAECQRLMLEHGGQSFSNDHGANCHWKEWESTTVDDWKTFSEWLLENGYTHMLKADCKKTAVIDYMKEHEDALPPGIKYDSGKKLHFRRGTK